MPRTVLLLHSSAGRYGADLQLAIIARGLDRTRYTPIVVLPERGELAAMLENAGVETHVRPLAVLRRRLISPRGLVSLGARLRRDVRDLGRLAEARKVRVVHSNTSVVLSGQAVADRSGAPHLVHVREIYTGAAGRLAARLWPVVRRRLERADQLLCVSAATAAQFDGRRARVVYDGLPRIPASAPRDRARAALDLPPDRFVVALLGRVSDWKGQDVLARALAGDPLREIGAIGLVAGEAFPGEERHERALAELRDRLQLGDRLRLLGFVDDPSEVLGAADAVAVPSIRPDPLPNSALEASAAGLPVVASALGGLPEIVSDGRTGALVPPGDAGALAAALRRLADDPAAARRLGEAAAADVRDRFRQDRMLEEIQDSYDRALGPS